MANPYHVPFFAGLLLSRVAKPTRIKNAFLWCSVLLAIVLYMPRIGGAEHVWMNGIYESVCIIILFPLIVYLGASGLMQTLREHTLCKFLGNISYPLYLVHYPLVYFYVAWISNRKGITIVQAWPYALLILIGGVVLAYAALKWYDEPVRKWLHKKLAKDRNTVNIAAKMYLLVKSRALTFYHIYNSKSTKKFPYVYWSFVLDAAFYYKLHQRFKDSHLHTV